MADDHKLTEEVVVRAHPLSAEGLSQPVSVLSGEELNKAVGFPWAILYGYSRCPLFELVRR